LRGRLILYHQFQNHRPRIVGRLRLYFSEFSNDSHQIDGGLLRLFYLARCRDPDDPIQYKMTRRVPCINTILTTTPIITDNIQAKIFWRALV